MDELPGGLSPGRTFSRGTLPGGSAGCAGSTLKGDSLRKGQGDDEGIVGGVEEE